MTEPQLENTIADIVNELAVYGGKLAMQKQTQLIVSAKNGDARDMVTNIDLEINATIVDRIQGAFPDHQIYSEETGMEATNSTWMWSIDPIDGTSNYIRGLPHYSCVITVLHHGVVTHAAVYAPVYDQLYTLTGGVPAVNGVAFKSTTTLQLSGAYVNFHPGRKESHRQWAGDLLQTLLGAAKKNMNLGSSALDLCYVAEGKTDVVIYGSLTTLDVAGAIAIVRAAGGEVYQYGSAKPVAFNRDPQKLIATTNHDLLQNFYRQVG